MNHLNSILIEGNLVCDPVLKSTPNGKRVCTFSMVSNHFYKGDKGLEEAVSFLDVEVWAKLAERCHTQGRKGRGVRIVGWLKQERWVGVDGTQHSKVSIVAEHVEFSTSRQETSPRDEITEPVSS